MGAVLISRSQPKILRKIQKNLRGYIPAIPRFLHVWAKLGKEKIVSRLGFKEKELFFFTGEHLDNITETRNYKSGRNFQEEELWTEPNVPLLYFWRNKQSFFLDLCEEWV